MRLPVDRLQWTTGRRDLLGRVFEFEGEFYRAIHPHRVDFARSLFERKLVQPLMDSGLLVRTEFTDLELEGYGAVLHHERIPVTTLGHEWPRSLLRDAALVAIEMNLALAKGGLGLFDPHCYNLHQMGCCRPIWSDFGSIVELDPANAKMGIQRFHSYFRNPLTLISKAPALEKAVRNLMASGGISDKELAAFQSLGTPDPSLNQTQSQGFWNRLLGRKTKEKPKKASGSAAPKTREHYWEAERKKLSQLNFGSQATRWGDYHPEDMLLSDGTAQTQRNPRQEMIDQLIGQLRPKRVIDMACNGGYFSFMAARHGAEVFAVDYDPLAIERLYSVARKCTQPFQIASSCYDLTIWRRKQNVGDLALALALTHHLLLSQSMHLEQVAQLLASYTTDALITEFMECGLGNTVPLPDPLPEFYTRKNYLDALSQHFHTVEVIPYDYPDGSSIRTLILCRGKKA